MTYFQNLFQHADHLAAFSAVRRPGRMLRPTSHMMSARMMASTGLGLFGATMPRT